MRKFSVFSIISLLCVLASVSLRAQDYRLGNPPTSDPAKPTLPVIGPGNVVTLCGDTVFSFTDGGGGANGDASSPLTNYGDNINQSLEFVSSLGTGGVIEVVFTDFFTSPGDVLEVFSIDGVGGAVSLGTLSNNLRGSISVGTPRRYYSRPGDVGLRFTFTSDASLNNPGWIATVREASAPSVIGLLDITGDPFTVLGPGVIGICSGVTQDFNAVASAPSASVTYKSFERPADNYTYTPVPGNFTYDWTSTEPASATTQIWQRTFATRNSFLLNVNIVTDKCRLLDTAVRVNVSTIPSFSGTSSSQSVCEGSSVQITGVVTATSSNNFDNPPVTYTYTPTVTADRWDNTVGGFDGPSTGAVVRVPAPTTGPGTYTYTFIVSDDYGNTGCQYDTSITITVNASVNAGLDGVDVVCASTNAFNLTTYLGPTVNNGSGRWIDFDASGLPLNTTTGILDLQAANTIYGTSLPRTFRYVYKIDGNPGCPADSAIVTLTIYPSAFAGNDASVTFCNNITPINLLSLVGTNQATGTWSTTFAGAGTITGNLLDPTTGGFLTNPAGYVGGGTYTYTYDISYPGTNAGCTDQSQVIIDFKETGVPGGDASIDLCSSDNPVDLFTVLTGTPDANGTWTTPGGYVFTGVTPSLIFDPGDPAQTNAPFTVTYTVRKNDPVCKDTSATISVNYQKSPNSGTAVSALTEVCTDAPSFDLNTTLDGSQDGSGNWTDNNGVSSLSGANNATVNLNTINFGANDTVTVRYTYTVNAINTLCNTSSTDVFVRYTRKSNAGVTRSIAVCENAPIFFVRDSMAAPGPDPSVTYAGAPAGSLVPTDFGARFNPATTGLAGTTVVITATDTANGPGCADAVATLTIDISERPDAGTSTDSARVCITETVYEMADNLSATATTGGFWTVAGGSLPNPAWLDNDGTVNIDATGGNGFPGCGMKLTFEYHATSPNCNEVISTHTLDVKCGADAGDDDSVYVCSTDPIFALGAFVTTTDQSGRWQDLDGSGALSAVTTFPATFEPGRVNTTGEYRMAYVVDNNPCTPPDTAYITVFVSRLPRAGVGDTASACEDETEFDLYTTLTGNFDREGRWELAMLPPYDANLNATVNGNRATYFKGAEESDFDVAAFMVLINSSTSPFFATQPSSFPPFVRLKYTVQDTTNYGPNPPLCRDSATFAILQISKLFNTPSPKSAVATEVCKTVSQFDLNSLVTGLNFYPYTSDDRLVWTDNSGVITAADIVNDSIISPSSLPAGDYTFTLSIQTAACDPIVVGDIKLRIVSVPNAGTSNSVTVCTNSTPVDIRTIVGGETGGSITKVQPTTPINGQGVTSYNPIDGPGTYVFEYRVVKAACPNSTSTANATIIVQAPPVTNGNQTANVCFGEQVAMRNVVPTTDPIATFSPNSTSGDCAVAIATNSPYNSAVFNAGLAGFALGATCVVDYTADNGVCPAVTNQITINISPRPDAGLDVVDTVCSTNSTYALVPGGTPTAGGSFSSSSPAVSGSNFNATLVAAPATVTAFYVVGGGACPRDTAFFTLRVEKAPEAGTDATIELCAEGSRVDMRTLLNGQVDLNGNFVAQVGAQQAFLGGSSSEIFDPVVFFNNFPGVSTFSFNHVVRGVNCPDDIATLTIRLVPAPRSGRGDTTIFLCQNQGTYSLFNALGLPGDYDLGGTWTSDGGPTSSFIDPSSYNPDTVQFVYSVPSAKCGPSNTVVTAIISAAPNSGADRADTLFLCAQGLTNLNQFLINGSNGGRWELHSGTAPTGNFATGQVILTSGDAGKRGTFRYITSAPGCANDTAFFRFNINGTPSPLADPNLVVCRTDNPTNLSGAYANFPAGGTFSLQPKAGTNNQAAITAGALSGNLFYSDLAGNGRYEFTLTTPGNGCVSVTQTLTVTVVGPGIDTSFTVCSNQNPIDIYDLTRADGITGVWNTTASVGTVPANLLVGNIFFPRRGVVGTTYTNTLTGNAVGCNAIARITIVDTISVSNVAGTNPAVDILCDKSTNSYQVRFRIRGGVAPYFVSGTNGSLAGDIFTSDPIAFGGIYTLFISSSTSCGSLTLRGSSECGDADNDGIFDQADLDDDNDGLPDLLEAGGLADANGDADGDGTPNYKDADFCSSQGGSMAGLVCALYDFDGDGIINQYDLDSDNDGISDLFEGLNASAALALESTPVDGMVVLNEPGAVKNGWTDAAESFFGPLNFTNLFNRVQKTTTGVADFLNLDSDGDSIADITEGAGSITVLPIDTDGDGTFDFRDLDSDDDGVSDYYESGLDINFVAVPNSDNDLLPDFRDTDSDNDGLLDGIDSRVAMFAGIPEDFDGDGLFNFQDDDSDNDNILDSDEKGPDATPRISFAGNTNPDYLNLDTDNDGICDIFEGHLPGQGKFDRVSDVDNDGDEDYRDRDTDNDGILDAIEGGVALGSCLEPVNTNGGLFHDYRSIDSDGDGLGDRFEAGTSTAVPADSDGDGVYDFQDFDSDNDCIPDSVEAIAPYDSKFTAGLNVAYKFDASSALPDYLNTDSDGDGIDDNVEAGANCASPVDSDGDGFPDFRDLDSDNDGASDRIENTGDCDGDGVPNFADAGDNCEILTDVPEGFSPNGDGVNDFFVIPAISEFPQASLKVYNRWGQLIFESNSYQNNWDGTFQKSGEDVPQGTYFYLLDLGLGDKAQKGTIYINR